MKIGIIVKEFPPNIIGGTETQAMRLAEQLSKRHDVTIFTKMYGVKKDYEYSGEYQIVRVPNIVFNSFLSTLTFVSLAIPYMYANICMMMYPNGFLGYILNKITGTPYTSWIRGGDWYFIQNNRFKMWMVSKVVQKSYKYPIIAQTELIKRDVLSVYPDANVKIIPNGVAIPGKIANGTKIYFVGNLIHRKGVVNLIEAMQEMNGELVIVGDGPEREGLRNLCEKYKVNCKFKGYINPLAIQKELINARVLVLPSIEGEGLPNVVLEAMSVGLPVVATNIAGIPDVVKDGETGFIVEPANVGELASKISEIVNNQSLWAKMSENCLREVEKYSWGNIIKRIEEVYDSCAG
jgi:glycosyltransferase involved in cell wall biosynthesis